MLPLAAVYPMAFRHSAQSKNRTMAGAVAYNTIETLKALPWGKPVPENVKADRLITTVVEGKKQAVRFHVNKLDFNPPNDTGDGPDPKANVCTVTLNLQWKEGTGASSGEAVRNITLTRVLTR